LTRLGKNHHNFSVDLISFQRKELKKEYMQELKEKLPVPKSNFSLNPQSFKKLDLHPPIQGSLNSFRFSQTSLTS